MGPAVHKYVKESLTNLKEFINDAKNKIDYKNKNLEDVETVISIMSYIGEIEKR
jgi:hypothetical protein